MCVRLLAVVWLLYAWLADMHSYTLLRHAVPTPLKTPLRLLWQKNGSNLKQYLAGTVSLPLCDETIMKRCFVVFLVCVFSCAEQVPADTRSRRVGTADAAGAACCGGRLAVQLCGLVARGPRSDEGVRGLAD